MGALLVNQVSFRMIACGQAHCIAVTNDNEIVCWGSNKFGQIGNGKQTDIETPYKILTKKEHIQDYQRVKSAAGKCGLIGPAIGAALLITLLAFIN